MKILALDPGYEQTAWVVYDTGARLPERFEIHPNAYMLDMVRAAGKSGQDLLTDFWTVDAVVIEMVASYGMAVGREVFETVFWIGRFFEAFDGDRHRLFRKDVKMHLCGNNTAKDSNIRAALIDRFGPGKEKACGTKKAPGPLYGVSKDVWAALAVAVTWADKHAPALQTA